MLNILFVCDVMNWAWHYKATEIKNNLPEYNIDIVYTKGTPLYSQTDLSKYDHIHVFGWYSISDREKPYINKISTSIASIEYEILRPVDAKRILSTVKIVAVSEYLYNHLLASGYKNVFACYNGVNEEKFRPILRTCNNKKLRVGYACKPPSTYDLHGYVIADKLTKYFENNENIEIVPHVANYKTAISHEKMWEYYNSLDVFIHTGRNHLGTPNPVFEASSCALPIVATTNGCIPLLITEGVNGYLIDINMTDEEKISLFIEKLEYLSNNRNLCVKMGENNRKTILDNWTWKDRAQSWKKVFES